MADNGQNLDLYAKILAYQIHGISFHLSLCKFFERLGKGTFGAYHKKQAEGESCSLGKTEFKLACCFNSAVMPATITPTVTVPKVDDTLTREQNVLAGLSAWVAWETEVSTLCAQAAAKDTTLADYFISLANDSQRELAYAHKMMKRIND